MSFNGSHLANFAVYAPALTRSTFTKVGCHDGRGECDSLLAAGAATTRHPLPPTVAPPPLC